MHVQLLNANFAQLVSAWKKSKYNKYSDADKQNYHESLSQLFNALKATDFERLTLPEKEEVKAVLQFFFTSLEFLDNSTINVVPFELVFCLKEAMFDWISDKDNYIIVTSFDTYSFNPNLVTNKIYSIIEKKYNILFKRKLVQISLPRHLSRDYLTNSVLYHELGHFVDITLKISEKITLSILDDYLDNKTEINNKKDLLKYLPFLKEDHLIDRRTFQIITMHIGEYFADIFASQYVGPSTYHYLKYVAGSHTSFVPTHPATFDRVNLIDEFLHPTKEKGYFIKKIIQVTEKATSTELKVRFKPTDNNEDILDLIPHEIGHRDQLHYLFNLGWEIWLNKTSEFKHKNGMVEELNPSQSYQIINNLIEKSINNYIVTKNWKNSKNVLN
ncbi:hypothetical protein E2605_09700 [Dysgonomonas capnocytophagoides]|uniref:Uncharacterized protein n=1 Tax=Dysgonomonas capnocytophagoides TaxID=45254 RepID=A0A4Y8L5S8_9BACT|nr:hypothetical protein [Dysgonomonas capnocytophagoides]TFD96430.1 hypothetical protein E2605_09700 [Dysgonomonas capnocytophagoides]